MYYVLFNTIAIGFGLGGSGRVVHPGVGLVLGSVSTCVFHPGFEAIFLPYLGYFSNKMHSPIDKRRFYLYLCEVIN